jgi:hypothetical protein
MGVLDKKGVRYVVWQFNEGEKEYQIDGKNLVYCQLHPIMHGCQCNHVGGTKEHDKITENLSKIAKLFQEIDEINNVEVELKN